MEMLWWVGAGGNVEEELGWAKVERGQARGPVSGEDVGMKRAGTDHDDLIIHGEDSGLEPEHSGKP